MHQSYLGGLYLIARGKVHPLWYSQYMHAMFYLSAIPAGLALTVFAIYLCMRSLNVRVDFTILSDCGRMIQLLLIVFAFFRVLDLVANHAVGYAFQRTPEAGYFWLEMALFVIIPIALLSLQSVRSNPEKLYLTCAVVIAGFMVNRLNVSINALQTAMGTHYVPKWTELASSVLLVAAASGGLPLRGDVSRHIAQGQAADLHPLAECGSPGERVVGKNRPGFPSNLPLAGWEFFGCPSDRRLAGWGFFFAGASSRFLLAGWERSPTLYWAGSTSILLPSASSFVDPEAAHLACT